MSEYHISVRLSDKEEEIQIFNVIMNITNAHQTSIAFCNSLSNVSPQKQTKTLSFESQDHHSGSERFILMQYFGIFQPDA